MELTDEYIRGFIDGEGCFIIAIRRKESKGLPRGRPRKVLPPKELGIEVAKKEAEPHEGYQIFGTFHVTQTKDIGKELLEHIQKRLGCGIVTRHVPKDPNHEVYYKLTVYSARDHTTRIIPFLEEHPMVVKETDYKVWKEAILAISSGRHLTQAGFEYLVSLKQKLEGGRKGKRRGGKWERLLK